MTSIEQTLLGDVNVSAQLKAFIDRTWCIKGKLRNKIGGAVVALLLKHEMIPANRGVHGRAYAAGDIVHDPEALTSAGKLGKRLLELGALLGL